MAEFSFIVLQSYFWYTFYEVPTRTILRKIWEFGEKTGPKKGCEKFIEILRKFKINCGKSDQNSSSKNCFEKIMEMMRKKNFIEFNEDQFDNNQHKIEIFQLNSKEESAKSMLDGKEMISCPIISKAT